MMTFEDFERDWLRRHRGSMVTRPRLSSWGLLFGLMLWGIIAVGAALVSGAHSVPAILQTIPIIVPSPYRESLSLSGFTIFELLIFAGALYRRDNRYAAWGLYVALAGALAANIGSSIHAVQENQGDWLATTVAVILAVIAPLAAFLAGEMVHHQYEQHRKTIDKAQVDYEQKLKDRDAIINREYVKYSKGQSEKVAVSVPALPVQADPHPVGAGFGYTRTPDGQKKVIEWLNVNTDKADLPARQLAEMIGVGKDTANSGRNAWIAGRSNGNGNSNHYQEDTDHA